MRLVRAGVVPALVAALLASAPASAGDQFKFTPPSGWVKVPGAQGMLLSLWAEPHPDGFRQNINLVEEPFAGTLSEYVAGNKKTEQGMSADVQFGPEADVTTCTQHPAHFLPWKATENGHKLIFEQVFSVWYGRGYVFTYTREQGQPAIDAARDALTTVCIRQSSE